MVFAIDVVILILTLSYYTLHDAQDISNIMAIMVTIHSQFRFPETVDQNLSQYLGNEDYFTWCGGIVKNEDEENQLAVGTTMTYNGSSQ